MNYFVDTHSHLDMIEDMPISELILNAENAKVKKIILPAANEASFEPMLEICSKYENCYALLGIYPSEAKTWNDDLIDKIKELSKNKKIVGIGEIGLDYYWDKSFIELQKDVFIKQIKLANELNFPLSIHDREAHNDTFDILVEHNKNSKVVLHCFSGSLEFAKECVKKGFYLGIGGVLTFKNSKKIKEVVENIDLKHLLLETDAPYLTPVPFRGETNQPAYVKLVAEEIARIKNIDIDEVAEVTTKNAHEVFEI